MEYTMVYMVGLIVVKVLASRRRFKFSHGLEKCVNQSPLVNGILVKSPL